MFRKVGKLRFSNQVSPVSFLLFTLPDFLYSLILKLPLSVLQQRSRIDKQAGIGERTVRFATISYNVGEG